jgi:hypothetical protein
MPEPIDVDADRGGIPAEPILPAATGDGSPYVRDELAAPPGVGDDGRTMLQILEDDLAGAETVVEFPPLALGRNPAYLVVFRKITDGDEIDRARKASKDPKKADGLDGTKFAALIAVTACQRIIRNGQVLADDEGRPLRFNHRLLLQSLTARSAAECAERFYADDAELDAVARRIMTDSGWGREVYGDDAADPQPAG